MRFYAGQHRFYCGVDLHTRTLSLCVLDSAGTIALEVTLPPDPDRLVSTLAPYRDGLVVGCECLFAWYWLADLCAEQGIPFVLRDSLNFNPRPQGPLRFLHAYLTTEAINGFGRTTYSTCRS